MVKIEVEKLATLTGHKDCIYSLERGIDSWEFYSAGGDGMVVKWDLRNPENGQLIARTSHSIYSMLLLPESGQLIIGENFEGLHKIDLLQNKEIQSNKLSGSSFFEVKEYKGKLFVASGDGVIYVLESENLSTTAKLKYSDKSVRSLSVNEEKGHLAAGYSDYSLRIFDLENFNLLYTVPAHQNSIFTAVYSPDGKYLLSGSRDAHLKIWEVDSDYRLKKSVVAHMYAINHVCYSPDANYIASCSMDKSVKIWDAEEFKLLKVIDKARHAGHGTSVNKLLWSSYQDQLISCSDDRSISVWNLRM